MPHAEPPPLSVDTELALLSRREASVTRSERWTAFALIAAASIAVASAFAAVGAWPIVPYSALEIALVGGAFWWMERRASRWERIAVLGNRVIVERGERGRCRRRELDRWRVQVELNRAGARDGQLTLRCAGEAFEFGDALPRERRVELARRLRQLTAIS